MTDLEAIIELNSNKFRLSIGDLVISSTFGIGEIIDIETDDVWNPIKVKFDNSFEIKFHHTKYKLNDNINIIFFDCKGGSSQTEEGDAKFYKQIYYNGRKNRKYCKCYYCRY